MPVMVVLAGVLLVRGIGTLAGQLEHVSRGNPSVPPNGFTDKNYVGGLNGMMSTAQDLKVACPEAGD